MIKSFQQLDTMPKISISFFILLFCWASNIYGQSLWSGDVNNNGIVNEVDILYWAWANGATGASRPDATTEWEAQNLPALWSQNFTNGLNYAYADCDGNGMVEEDDLDVIEDNFGLQHGSLLPDGFQNGEEGKAIKLRLETENNVVALGSTVQIRLSLDNAVGSNSEFYGMALKMSYTADVLEGDDAPDFDLTENNWIYASDDEAIESITGNDVTQQAGLAITRTNQQSVPIEEGEIGLFSVVMEDIILYSQDTFLLTIDSVLLFDENFSAVAVVPDTIEIIVAKDPKEVTAQQKIIPISYQLYPNPCSEKVFLTTSIEVSDLVLVNQLGRTFPLIYERLELGQYHIDLPQLPKGIYWIKARTRKANFHFKILLLDGS